MENPPAQLNDEEFQSLKTAKKLLENPGIAIKLSSMIGNPIQKGLDMLPKNWNQKLIEVTQNSLLKAADTAIFTMNNTLDDKPSNILHKIAAGATGTIGGLFGIASIEDDNLESSYYITRTFLSNSMSQTTKYVSEQGIVNEGAPLVLNIIGKIAERFGLQVTEKSMAQSVPIIGAAFKTWLQVILR